jgi:hypothetical protein
VDDDGDDDGETLGLSLALGEALELGLSDGLGLDDSLPLGDGLSLLEGEAEDEGDTELLPLADGENEVDVEAEGDGLTDGEPTARSTGASVTANATRTTLSVSQAISRSSLLSITRRRNDSQRRLVKVGTAASRVNTSSVPLGATPTTSLITTVLS